MNSTDDKVGWTAEPNGRGTMGLLWSCFATIFLCVWSAFHPNVPADDDTPWTIFARRCRYMVVGIFAPELVAWTAGLDMIVVANIKKKYSFSKNGTFWTSKMYFLLLMGGFALETGPGQLTRPAPKELIRLLDEGVIEMPELEDSDIDDRSKADWFTKSIAVLQIVWFLAQLLGRAIQRLPTTTLELFTASIVFCGSCAYAFWWKKPFDIKKPVVLRPASQHRSASREWPRDVRSVGFLYDKLEDAGDAYYVSSGIAIILLFAAFHIVGWNFQFPSHSEKILWRVASAVCGGLPLILFSLLYFLPHIGMIAPPSVMIPGLAFYVIVRLYLLVEIFIGLRSVPAGVYETPQWSQYFPAFG
ncbi:hypothetical protein K491DRAFT_637520 [Lophiostoma macrostomum CBS 122681]|uniref:Uncharacterized protein n=1 Tax=Lophiostoma macrostomum CBS 122681 TaxID=1314788 RepID=A0A6A6SUX1_9PLEO|nr:hypothetical protein K491DRAFT_637520 [Lophiostoma macrostomum CBS 122681]